MKKSIFIILIFLVNLSVIFSQESLKSVEEEYFDFLALQGLIERPTLGYRTLSDSVWNTDDNVQHIWKNNNLGKTHILFESENQGQNWFSKGFFHGLKLKLFGPEWFNSYNTTTPYGQNDGALWQGKGYNTSFTTGVRLEGYGFEATFKPQFCFSQNLEFDYVTPNYENEDDLYKNKAGLYGYYGVSFIDAPQRFGDKAFFTFDLGDTEIRYTWKNFTIGFGTQSIWLGPAQINPILHSNNAPTYPKIDFGLRRSELNIPWGDLYLGDLEFRCWWGKLTESNYFDNDVSNNHNLISAFSVTWNLPWIFKGLSIGYNRTMVSKWNHINPYTLFEIYIPWMRPKAGEDESDQRASITLDYFIPNIGFEVYLEWARNDFQTTDGNFLRYPFHTQAYTVGGKKEFCITNDLKGKLIFEVSFLECSHDYMTTYPWYSTFYGHHIITQGYTNKGQWLGAGIGTGGNSQYLGFELFYQKGKSSIFVYRFNPDLDYLYFLDPEREESYASKMKTILDVGTNSIFFIKKNISLLSQFDFIINLSNNYERLTYQSDFSIKVGCNLNF